MKAVYIAFILICMLFQHHANAQSYPKLPLTEGWYHIQGQDADKYMTFRRYSFVIDTPDNPIRNTIILNCSADEINPSYITFVIPKEISLARIYGTDHVQEKIFSLYTMSMSGDSKRHKISGEVKKNEIFFDFIGEHKSIVDDIINATKIYILLKGEEVPIEFAIPDSNLEIPFEGKTFKFDEFVRVMMDRSGKFTRYLQSDYLYEHCSDLKKWRSEKDK